MYARIQEQRIRNALFKGKVVIIYGPRRVGKTTLVQKILKNFDNTKYLSGEEVDVATNLSRNSSFELKNYIGSPEVLVIDEAQKIPNIGLTLKLLVDNYPKMQIIATGSSSFDLANEVGEPLTGRSFNFKLYPLSIDEILEDKSGSELQKNLSKVLKFGLYPDIFKQSSNTEMVNNLESLKNQYLYRDILAFDGLKNSRLIHKLTQLLAFQIGSEVSSSELSKTLGVTRYTVEKYIDLLEKSFVIFRLWPFSRNLRNELTKKEKIYFWDLGIRNSLIGNFNDLDIRPDAGSLWENFCIIERFKYNHYTDKYFNPYFWRTTDQKEIDYIEDSDGLLHAFEFKLNPTKKAKPPKGFVDSYPSSSFEVINSQNFLQFIS